MKTNQIIDNIKSILPENLYQNFNVIHETINLTTNANSLLELLKILKENPACAFSVLTDLCGVDYLPQQPRFSVIYNLLSLSKNLRLIIKLPLAEEEESPSIANIFSNAVWLEREVWDMYGIIFYNSPDLRRILTDYEFEGHPLRKDFPLTGYKELRYDNEIKKVIYEPVPDAQQYRDFDYLSPWEGPNYAIEANKKG